MNIELTTENLRQCCRLCLNTGEFNIWEQSEGTSPNTLEVMKIFKDYDSDLLGLGDELKLLCQFCLENLRTCYTFYKKAVETSKQIQRLFIEAQKIEAEQLADAVLEVQDNDSQRTHEIENNYGYAFVDECGTSVSLDDLIEEDNYQEEDINEENVESDLKESEESEDIINGTEFLNECDKDNTELLDYLKPKNCKPISNKTPKEKVTRTAEPSLPLHEDGSLVVTQFLPSTAHIVYKDPTEEGNLTQEYEDNYGAGPALSTVDFAAVEVKSSSYQKIIEEELLLQSTNEEADQSNRETIDEFGSIEEGSAESSNSVYVCKYCPQAFTAIFYLISHVRKSHVCKYCTQAFSKSVDLFVHIRQEHHQHKCAICSKELSSHSNLRGHIKRVHGIRLPAQVALLHYRPPNEMDVVENDMPQ